MLETNKDGKSCRLCDKWKLNKDYRSGRTECRVCEAAQKRDKRNLDNKKKVFTTLNIGDIQAPYGHPDTIPFLKAVNDKYAPDEIISGGDEFDMYWLNAYGTDPDFDNPEGEYYKARAFWQQIFKIFPEGVGVTSNHVHGRMDRKRKQARLPSHFMKSWEEIIGAPKGWKWVDQYITQGTLVRHGHADGKSAKVNLDKINHKRLFTNQKPLNLMLFHHHTLMGCTDIMMGQHVVWMGFGGSLIDKKAHAFNYTNTNPALGCTLIRDGRLFPIPMIVDENDRWVGEL